MNHFNKISVEHSSIPERALVIASPHIDRILNGDKTWEMRSRGCNIRGTIGLIRKGSGQIVGTVEISGTQGPFNLDALLANQDKHRIESELLSNPAFAKWNIAWVLKNVRRLSTPVSYRHPNGAQSWVKLDDTVRLALAQQINNLEVA